MLLGGVLLMLLAILALTTTQSGTRWLLPRVLEHSPWPLQLQYQAGTLWSDLRVRQVHLTHPRWALQIDELGINWRFDGSTLILESVQAQQVDMQIFPSDATTIAAPQKPWRIPVLPLQVKLQQVSIAQLRLQHAARVYPPMALQLTADWQEVLAGELRLQVKAFDPVIWSAQTSAKLDADLRLRFRHQYLKDAQHQPQASWQLQLLPSKIEGVWQQSPLNAQLSADWQTQQASQLAVDMTLADNQFKISGNLAAINKVNDGQAWLNAPLQLNWQLQAGQLTQVWPKLQGQLQARGQLSGSMRDPILQAQLRSDQVHYDSSNSGQLQLQKLQADLHVQARLPWPLNRDDWQINLLPSQLTAHWRGQPLSIQAEAFVDAKQASQLLLKSTLADNQLAVALQQPFVFSWQLNAPKLAQLWPNLHGQVISQGHITGSLRDPMIHAQVTAKQLLYRQKNLKAPSLQMRAPSPPAPLPRGERGDRVVEMGQLSLLVKGKLSQHDLQLSAKDPRGDLQLSAQGGLNMDAASGRYRLLKSSFAGPSVGQWVQQQPREWSLRAGKFHLERTCWTQVDGHLCAELQGESSALVLDAQLTALPLAQLQASYLQRYLPPALTAKHLGIEGSVSGDLRGQYQNKQWLGNAKVQVTSGALIYPLQVNNSKTKSKRYSWRRVDLQLQHDAQQTQASWDWDYQQYGFFKGNLRRRADGDLSGQWQAQFQQLPLLEPFLVGVQDLQGQVLLNMQLSGRLPTPSYIGHIQWQKGRLRIPGQNLLIDDIEVRGDWMPSQPLLIAGKANSDRGQVQLSGQLVMPTQWPKNFYQSLSGQLRLQGKDFQVSNTSRSKIWASPDLTLALAPEKMLLTGVVELPQAAVRLKELPQAVVQVSKDVVMITDGQPQPRPQPGWQQYLTTDVKVVLGPLCNFQGLGLQADLKGELQLLSLPQKPVQAYGEILIPKGSYQKYGQNLTIGQGVLRFQGAADNPALNIQAVRHTEVADVTLALGGTLKMPSSKVYSSPPLPDSEAMALLVTGKPLSSASAEDNNRVASAAFSLGVNRSQSFVNRVAKTVGVDTLKIETGSGLNDSALLIGKYLNPNLYITYIRGLFAQTSSVGMEYKLTPKTTIKAQSGSESSLDVLYRFERD
jgi:translocation and assembly module TamB